jgi:prepilin-type N-terminal cleavage/methylation domain-containing protein
MTLKIGSKAFTLVEIMLTVTILAVGLIGIVQAYLVSINALEAGDYTVRAVSLAKEKIAQTELDIRKDGGISTGFRKGVFDGTDKNFTWELNVVGTSVKDLNEAILVVYSAASPRKYYLATYAKNKKES